MHSIIQAQNYSQFDNFYFSRISIL